MVTMIREAVDDFRRWRRDIEINGQKFKKLTKRGVVEVPSSQIKVSDFLIIEKVSPFF